MADRAHSDIRETSTTGGTGNQVLAGAFDGSYRAFSAKYSDGDKGFAILKQGSARELTEFTYNAGANSISRSTPIWSTNSNNLVNFSAGQTIDIFDTLPGPTDLSASQLARLAQLLGGVGFSAAQSLTTAQKALAQANIFIGPTTQAFTSGTAATYTTPANVKWIEVFIIGGGGGGGSSGTSGGSAGTAGGNSTFNSVTAKGGAGGLAGPSGTSTGPQAGGAGGNSGSGTATRRAAGQGGGSGGTGVAGVYSAPGGAGGASGNGFGGGGAGCGGGGNGVNAPANGFGGGGGGAGGTGGGAGPGAGGGGECAYLIINSPSATYTYTVGAAGAGASAGSGGTAGGSGTGGYILVVEHYGS